MARRLIGFAFVLALAAMLASSATGLARGTEKRITLTPTTLGARQDISGTARVRTDRGRQDFKVSMDARVASGTTFTVTIANSAAPGKTFVVGKIAIQRGRGELEVSNENGRALPAGVAPVMSITTVTVTNSAGLVVLRGSFA
jgi:hypothetical protein